MMEETVQLGANVGRDPAGNGSESQDWKMDPDDLREASRRLKEPDWLADWRVGALERFHGTPVPIRADHLWRYTDPALLEARVLPSMIGAKSPAAGDGATAGSWDALAGALHRGDLSGAACTADGRMQRAELSPELARAGGLLMDFADAASERPDLLRRILGTMVGPEFGRFEAMNGACFSGGLFLYVPRNVVMEKPIHIVERSDAAGFHACRLAVLVDDGSSLALIDEVTGDSGEDGHFSQVAELEVGVGSSLQYASIQTLSRRVKAHLTQRSRLGRSARYSPVIASFGGSLAKVDSGAFLDGEGSESRMIGFVSSVGRQRFDHHTVHHHRGRHTQSDLDFKTVLKDRSRSAYTGLIRIEPEAAFSEAYQENRNLLLSEDCRASSIPELEILTEEVQCKHGATVGPIDPSHLYYLMSRGIPEKEAVQMIVEGHFERTLVRLPEGLQARLRVLLRERLR